MSCLRVSWSRSPPRLGGLCIGRRLGRRRVRLTRRFIVAAEDSWFAPGCLGGRDSPTPVGSAAPKSDAGFWPNCCCGQTLHNVMNALLLQLVTKRFNGASFRVGPLAFHNPPSCASFAKCGRVRVLCYFVSPSRSVVRPALRVPLSRASVGCMYSRPSNPTLL